MLQLGLVDGGYLRGGGGGSPGRRPVGGQAKHVPPLGRPAWKRGQPAPLRASEAQTSFACDWEKWRDNLKRVSTPTSPDDGPSGSVTAQLLCDSLTDSINVDRFDDILAH